MKSYVSSGFRRKRDDGEEEHYWPSFTDIMSSLVFVLFFLILILFIKQILATKAWDDKLSLARTDLAAGQELLREINTELEQKESALNAMESTLSVREGHISELEKQLNSDRSALSSKEMELQDVQTRLQEISVLRVSLLNQVKKTMEEELGSAFKNTEEPLVTIDKNASLVISSTLIFDKGSSEITASGQALLKKLADAFLKMLETENFRDYIESITIAGYADSDDTYDNNYYLSCDRAIAVIIAMMKASPRLEKDYGSFFQAAGFSEFRPVAPNTDEASKTKNRRIEISLRIKDASIEKIIKDYVD